MLNPNPYQPPGQRDEEIVRAELADKPRHYERRWYLWIWGITFLVMLASMGEAIFVPPAAVLVTVGVFVYFRLRRYWL